MLTYALIPAFAMFGISLAAVLADRHFVRVMLAMEFMLVASSIVFVSFFSFSENAGGDGLMMLISIWAVAAVEGMAIIALYTFMRSGNLRFDVSGPWGLGLVRKK